MFDYEELVGSYSQGMMGLVLGELNIYQNLVLITMCGDLTWWVSDCEELVGVGDSIET